MTLDVRILDEAAAELQDAADWYQERSDGLGLILLGAVDTAIDSLARWPRSGSVIDALISISRSVELRSTDFRTTSPTSLQATHWSCSRSLANVGDRSTGSIGRTPEPDRVDTARSRTSSIGE